MHLPDLGEKFTQWVNDILIWVKMLIFGVKYVFQHIVNIFIY